MQYGTLEYTNLPIGDFEGALAAGKRGHKGTKAKLNAKDSTNVDIHNIPLHNKYQAYLRAQSGNAPSDIAQSALTALNAELAARKFADSLFDTFARRLASYKLVATNDASELFTAPSAEKIIAGTACQKQVDQAVVDFCGGYTDYSLKYHRVVVNACAAQDDQGAAMVNLLKDVCQAL